MQKAHGLDLAVARPVLAALAAKIMTKYIGPVITIIGLAIFAYSFNLDVYTDADAYNHAYLAIDRAELGREASFERFYALREQFLTNKYRYQNYGITFFVLGLFLVFLARNGWRRISALSAKWKTVLLGFGAAFLTTAGYVGDLFLEFSRGSYPHWADSLGIPLASVPVLFCMLIGWAAINMLGLKGNFVAGATISGMGFRNINWWYGVLAVVTALIVAMCIYDGYFWLVLPGLLWFYFYLSIMAGRKAANKSIQPTTNASAD